MNLEIDTKKFKELCLEQEQSALEAVPFMVESGIISKEEGEEIKKICLENISYMKKEIDAGE